MCGHYLTPEQAAIEREWDLRGAKSEQYFRAFLQKIFNDPNTVPGGRAPLLRILRDSDGQMELTDARWGLIPAHWQGEPRRDTRGKPLRTFNAKMETLRASDAYQSSWSRGQHCLVPVRAFHEWQAQPPDWQRTVRHEITCNDQDIFCFAGLWDQSMAPDGTVIESVTVITMPANELMKQIHNSRKWGARRELLPERERRMPAILQKEDQRTWLTGSAEDAWAVLKPYPSERIVARPES